MLIEVLRKFLLIILTGCAMTTTIAIPMFFIDKLRQLFLESEE